jgi:hypothetical protein
MDFSPLSHDCQSGRFQVAAKIDWIVISDDDAAEATLITVNRRRPEWLKSDGAGVVPAPSTLQNAP